VGIIRALGFYCFNSCALPGAFREAALTKLTGKLAVPPGNNGCFYYPDCLTCPFSKCKLEIPPEDRRPMITCPYCRKVFRSSGRVELQKCPKCKAELLCPSQ
jgi:hypothetical protein